MASIDSDSQPGQDPVGISRVDPRLSYFMTEVAELRNGIGLSTALRRIEAQMLRTRLALREFVSMEKLEDLNDIDIVAIHSSADRILRGFYMDRLEKRDLPLAVVRITLRDDSELDAQERLDIHSLIAEQFAVYALQVIVNGLIVSGPRYLVDLPNQYWSELMRFLIMEAVSVCDQELQKQESPTKSRDFEARQARRQRLRDDLRQEVASINDDIRGRIVQLLQGTRSQTQLIADLNTFDDYRKQRLQAALASNAHLPEIESFAAHVEGFNPAFTMDAAAVGSLNNGLLSAVVAVVTLNPLATIYSARGFLGAWLGSKRLSSGEASQLNDRVAGLIQRDQGKMYRAIDKGILALAATEPRWRLVRTVRRAAALVRRLPMHV